MSGLWPDEQSPTRKLWIVQHPHHGYSLHFDALEPGKGWDELLPSTARNMLTQGLQPVESLTTGRGGFG